MILKAMHQKIKVTRSRNAATAKMTVICVELQVDVQLFNSTKCVRQYPQGAISANIERFDNRYRTTFVRYVRSEFAFSWRQTRMVHISMITKMVVRVARATRLPTNAVLVICRRAASFVAKYVVLQVAVIAVPLSKPAQPCAPSKIARASDNCHAMTLMAKEAYTTALDMVFLSLARLDSIVIQDYEV